MTEPKDEKTFTPITTQEELDAEIAKSAENKAASLIGGREGVR